jgi:hypothetical protein
MGLLYLLLTRGDLQMAGVTATSSGPTYSCEFQQTCEMKLYNAQRNAQVFN